MDIKNSLKVFREFVKSEKLRYTHQREEIFKEFMKRGGHLTVEELYFHLRKKNPDIGFSTVYRTLKLMEKGGFISRVSFDTKAHRYESSINSEHHDHFVCINCKKIIEFSSPTLESLQKEIAKKYNFEIRDHHLELFGLCEECGGKKSDK